MASLPPQSPPATGDAAAPIVALRPIHLLPLALIAVVLFAAATVFMRVGTVNVATFNAVQAVTRGLPDTAWSMITICGEGVVAFALLAPSLTRAPRWFAAAIVAASLAGLYSFGLKHLFSLPRPAAVLDPLQVHIIGHVLRSNTYPSGHAVTAFTLASLLVFASTRPARTAAWALPLALLIAVSRMAVGAHWPADVAAGAAGGWLCGAAGVVVVARWRNWNTIVGVRLMGIVAIGIGVSLFVVDVGYPLALPLQYAAAVLAILSGAVTLARPRLDPFLPPAGPADPPVRDA
jgi:membrane-associated phospholipid phosphatase